MTQRTEKYFEDKAQEIEKALDGDPKHKLDMTNLREELGEFDYRKLLDKVKHDRGENRVRSSRNEDGKSFIEFT